MEWKSGALGQTIVSDIEKTAGVQWMGTREEAVKTVLKQAELICADIEAS